MPTVNGFEKPLFGGVGEGLGCIDGRTIAPWRAPAKPVSIFYSMSVTFSNRLRPCSAIALLGSHVAGAASLDHFRNDSREGGFHTWERNESAGWECW